MSDIPESTSPVDDLTDGERRDYDLAPELTIDQPAQLKALGDPLRSTVLDLVLERAMTVTELAERLHRPRGTVAYHVDVLVDAGLLTVVRTRQVRAIQERFYGRPALTYLVPHQRGEIPFLRDVMAEIDLDRLADDPGSGTSTYRHARIPSHRVREYADRLYALSLEFAEEPKSGDTEFGLYINLFPTHRRSARRPEQDEHDSKQSGT